MMTTDECFISVYGTLRRHPWLDAENLDHDAYSVFNTYSETLGWSSSSTYPVDSDPNGVDPGHEVELWGMNDAGGNWSDLVESTADHLIWVQTGLTKAAEQVGLPIAQLGVCTEKVLERIGVTSLVGMQMILPVGRAATPRPKWLEGALAMADPAKSAVVQVEIEGGADDTCIRNSSRIIDELNVSCSRDGIEFSSAVIDRSPSHLLEEPENMDRTSCLGPSVGRIRTHASIPEFSLDTSVYLTRYITRSCKLAGVTGSVLTTIRI